MKKILVLSLALIAVIAITASGTWAYFNDVIAVSGNTITAGHINLDMSVANRNAIVPISISDIIPGDAAKTETWALKVNANIPGTFKIAIGTVTNTASTTPYPVKTILGWDGTSGMLGGKLKVSLWLNTNGTGPITTGDFYFDPATTPGTLTETAYTGSLPTYTLDQYSGCVFTDYISGDTDYGVLNLTYAFPDNGATDVLADHAAVLAYNTEHGTSLTDLAIGLSTDNIAQGDKCAFDLAFSVIQNTYVATAGILGVTAPVADGHPVAAITATSEYTGTVTWVVAEDPFVAGHSYTATITLTPQSGYSLRGVAANYFTVVDATTVTSTVANPTTGVVVVTAVFPNP